MKNHELDIVEELTPSEMEKELTHSFGVREARNVDVPATQDSFAPTV
jgi:hypothetical protein